MADRGARSGKLIWAVVGGLVLVPAVTVAVIVGVTSTQDKVGPTRTATETPASSPAPSPSSSKAEVVDPTASEKGWVPEPVTTDAEMYLRSAIEAAGTADTTLSSRDEWAQYLDTWFTPDPRFTNPDEQADQTLRYQQELREAVVFPEQVWDSLASKDGRVVAAVTGEVAFQPVPDYNGDDMSIGTTDVTLTFTEADESGVEHSYDEQVRISAQVLCGAASVPAPNSSQSAGDCKLIRYFDQALGG